MPSGRELRSARPRGLPTLSRHLAVAVLVGSLVGALDGSVSLHAVSEAEAKIVQVAGGSASDPDDSTTGGRSVEASVETRTVISGRAPGIGALLVVTLLGAFGLRQLWLAQQSE